MYAHPKGVKPVHQAPTGHSHTREHKDTQPYMTLHPDLFPSALIRSSYKHHATTFYTLYIAPSLILCYSSFPTEPMAGNREVRKGLIAQRVLRLYFFRLSVTLFLSKVKTRDMDLQNKSLVNEGGKRNTHVAVAAFS